MSLIYNANRDPKQSAMSPAQFNPTATSPPKKKPNKRDVFAAFRAMVAPGVADPIKQE